MKTWKRGLDAFTTSESVEAGLAESVLEEHDDHPLGEGDVRQCVPYSRQDLDEQKKQHQNDVLTSHRHREHDDQHGEVEGSGVPARRIPHFDALRLRPQEEARRQQRNHVSDYVEHGEGGYVLGGGSPKQCQRSREGEDVSEAAASAEPDQPLGVGELRTALGACLSPRQGR